MISEVIAKHEILRAKQLIEAAHSVAIVTHMGPDGDAMGASLGLKHFLTVLGKSPIAVMVPTFYPDFLAWMPGARDVLVYEHAKDECDIILREADLIICADFNTLNRIGQMEALVRASTAKKLLIDHHLDKEDFADGVISYPDISSTSELVFRLICRMGYFTELTLPMAECIYTGMMTDTGNFSYNSNQSEIYVIVSELVKKGVDKDLIYRKVFDTYSYDRMRLMGYCLYRKMKVYPEYRAALITLAGKELYQFHFKSGDAEGLVNLPLSIDNVDFSVLMREDKDKIKISLRSQGDFPVNKVAAELFNGGGHLNAAGGESYISLEATVQKFEDALPSFFEHKTEE